MKAHLFGKNSRGFSTLEIMIAFAIMSVVMGGVIIADFSANYWAIAAQTSNEGLYKAKTRLEELRATARQNFYQTVSSPSTKDPDASCTSGSLCYFVESKITELSSCSKYAQAEVDWQVSGYPTTTTSLFTHLTNPTEAIALGGDCPLNTPTGVWSGTSVSATASFLGTAQALDVLSGVSYIGTNGAPYLQIRIAGAGSALTFANGFHMDEAINGIDVARDAATGRTYAYLAMASSTKQLQIIDVTDPANPVQVAYLKLNNVDSAGSFPQGWRVFYYDRKVYISTRETATQEFHVIDVGTPQNPTELGGLQISTSPYGIAVRDMLVGSTVHRIAYLATSKDDKELLVLDVTNPASITEVTGASTNLPGDYDGRSVFLAGNMVYVGRVQNSAEELYVLDASNLLSASGGLPILKKAEIGGDVLGIRASGAYVYVGNTKSGNQLQIFSTDATGFTQISHRSITNLASIDLEGNYLYTAGSDLQLIQSP